MTPFSRYRHRSPECKEVTQLVNGRMGTGVWVLYLEVQALVLDLLGLSSLAALDPCKASLGLLQSRLDFLSSTGHFPSSGLSSIRLGYKIPEQQTSPCIGTDSPVPKSLLAWGSLSGRWVHSSSPAPLAAPVDPPCEGSSQSHQPSHNSVPVLPL